MKRLNEWARRDVWQVELGGVPTFKRLWTKVSRVVLIAVRGFRRDECTRHAMALTYITIFALPPFLAFVFSIAKGMGFYQDLKTNTIDTFLNTNFAADEGGQVRQAIDQIFSYVENTPLGSVAAIGLIVILYAVLKLLGSVEHTLNDIWGIQRSRSFVRKVTDYLAIVTVAPVLLLAGAGLTAFVTGGVDGVWKQNAGEENAPAAAAPENPGELAAPEGPAPMADDSVVQTAPSEEAVTAAGESAPPDAAPTGAAQVMRSPVVGLASTLMIVLGMAFVIFTLPNTRVSFASAALGGLVSGSLWQLLQLGGVYLQVWLAGKNAIYSSLAAIPMLMIWIYLSWIILLVGAEVACAHQSEPVFTAIARTGKIDQRLRETIAPRAMARIADAFLRGDPAPSAAELAHALGLAPRAISQVLEHLVEARLLARTEEGDDERYVPGRDLETIRLGDVLSALRREPDSRVPGPRGVLDERADAALAELQHVLEASPANRSLRELLGRETREPRSGTGPESAAR